MCAPAIVTAATADYLDSEDALAGWLAECCITDANLHEESSRLFTSWRTWAETAGEFVGSQKRFTQAMVSKGFAALRFGSGKGGIRGVGLKPPSPNHERYGDPPF